MLGIDKAKPILRALIDGGSKADFAPSLGLVRFAPKSGHARSMFCDLNF
jgi:hypothetical protein